MSKWVFGPRTRAKFALCFQKTSFHFPLTLGHMYYSPPGTALIWGECSFAQHGLSVGSGFEFFLHQCLAGWCREVTYPLVWEEKKKKGQLLQGGTLEITTAPVPQWGLNSTTCSGGSDDGGTIMFFSNTSGFQNQIMEEPTQHLSFLFLIITSDILYPHYCMWAHPTVLGLCGQAAAGLSQGLQEQPASIHCPVTPRCMFLTCKHQPSCCHSSLWGNKMSPDRDQMYLIFSWVIE